MKPDRLFVFDTNVLVSAFLFKKSVPRQALDRAIENGALVRSEETSSELRAVLMRSKFDKYISVQDRVKLLDNFEQIALLYTVVHTESLCRDPKDDKFLNLALSAKSELIVSGDQDLLVLSPTFPIAIMTPAQFLDLQ
jgi:uncharacterized protein